jgi:acid phosphatase (class A)
MKRPAFSLLPLAALIALAVLVADPSHAANAANAVYVAAEQTRVLQILPSPPAADSAAGKAELVVLHQLQLGRTPEQVAQARADEKDASMFLFHTVLGDKFNAAQLPLTAALSRKIADEQSANTVPAKTAFHRRRPYNLDKTLQAVCTTGTGDDSYPSGHATAAYLQALVLVEMVPEQRDAILARAAGFAHNRLVCGVHYPSDLEAGQVLAYAVHALLDGNPQFRRDLRAARAELRMALGLPPMRK